MKLEVEIKKSTKDETKATVVVKIPANQQAEDIEKITAINMYNMIIENLEKMKKGEI